jgi:hypothetical protein
MFLQFQEIKGANQILLPQVLLDFVLIVPSVSDVWEVESLPPQFQNSSFLFGTPGKEYAASSLQPRGSPGILFVSFRFQCLSVRTTGRVDIASIAMVVEPIDIAVGDVAPLLLNWSTKASYYFPPKRERTSHNEPWKCKQKQKDFFASCQFLISPQTMSHRIVVE